MAVVSQGTLRDIRNQMFEHMQGLPVRYFDSHTFGEVMSYYTNDTDTLRQMISQSLPQFLSSAVSIIAVFISMLYLSLWMTAFVLLFKDEQERIYLKPYFWIPEESYNDKVKKENVFYADWVEKGYVRMTPGNVTDYDYIMADITNIAQQYHINSIAYDRWNSSQMVINMQNEGFEMSPFGQGYGSMSAPTKELEKMVLTSNLEHFANPVLRWMMASVAIQRDPAGNIKPDKRKSSQKIDGVVATIMAMGEMMTAMANQNDNPYNFRGMRTL
jgi:phage terminase large subunit-like protein